MEWSSIIEGAISEGGAMITCITHKDCIDHDMGYGHPEQPDRLRVIHDLLGVGDLSAPQYQKIQMSLPPDS
ncbi:MAG: hypothetical protein R3261_09760, partial [Alphaproteobacteria bacterium]|nr:hypothetical protein [Alphaproteobacteria bacterium]